MTFVERAVSSFQCVNFLPSPISFCAIGYYTVMRWGGNNELKRCFIIRLVYTRDPVMSTIRPIVCKKSPVAIFVFGNDQSVVGNAMIKNCIGYHIIINWRREIDLNTSGIGCKIFYIDTC